jgi:hypothetical protein
MKTVRSKTAVGRETAGEVHAKGKSKPHSVLFPVQKLANVMRLYDTKQK